MFRIKLKGIEMTQGQIILVIIICILLGAVMAFTQYDMLMGP